MLLGGRVAFYERLLHRFATEYADQMDRLRELLREGQQDDARRLVHSLRGVAGSLCMADVQRMATELEAVIVRSGDAGATDPLVGRLDDELRRLTGAILAALPADTVAMDTQGVDWKQARLILVALEPLLASGNMQANQLIETHRALLHAAFGPIGAELERCVERFLYQDAQETLKLALKELALHET